MQELVLGRGELCLRKDGIEQEREMVEMVCIVTTAKPKHTEEETMKMKITPFSIPVKRLI